MTGEFSNLVKKKNVDPRSSVELNQDKYIENNHT